MSTRRFRTGGTSRFLVPGSAERRAAVVVDRDEGGRREGIGDVGALHNAHVEVDLPGQHHGVAEILQLRPGEEGHPEVDIAFDEAVRPHGPRLRAAVPGIQHHIYAAELVALVEEDLGAAGSVHHPAVAAFPDDREDGPVVDDDACSAGTAVGCRDRDTASE